MIHNIYRQEYTAAQIKYLRGTYKVIDETVDRITVDIDDDSYEVINAIFRARWMSNEEFEQYMHVTLPEVEERVRPLAWEEVNTLYKGLEKYTRNRIDAGCNVDALKAAMDDILPVLAKLAREDDANKI